MKPNSELLNEFTNSKGDSKKMWKLLYTELLYNDSDLNSNIIFEINKCLSNNKNFDLILDIIDFCLVYGKKEIIDKILACLELNGFFYLNSNKGKKTNENTAKKIFYLIKKWSDILGNNFPKFKEMYKKISKYNNFFKNIKEIKTYLKFISEEDISDEKFIFEFILLALFFSSINLISFTSALFLCEIFDILGKLLSFSLLFNKQKVDSIKLPLLSIFFKFLISKSIGGTKSPLSILSSSFFDFLFSFFSCL